MKKVKFSLALIALVVAVGASVSTMANTAKVKAACTTTNPKTSGECPGADNTFCCTKNGQDIFRQ